MDWDQYKAWCEQWTGPCGHHWSASCHEGCHTPCTPWNDRPTGHTNPPPMNFCPPPIPKPVPGESPMECMNRLYAEVCACMKQCGELNAKAEHMLNDLHTYGLKNGAYYGPDVIKVEEGYQQDDSCPYKVVRIKHHDHYGVPVEVKLHLAYGNTTNAGIKEQAEDASVFELAQIIVPAIGSIDKWYGNVIYQRAPLPSNKAADKYTYGFTGHGTLKVYKDSYIADNPNILERDGIVTAMGCDGVLIRDGSTTSGADVLGVSDYANKAARVLLGQNANTKELFIFVAGAWGEDYPGVTCPHAVEVLMGYGCTTAIQLISGDDSVALNQGDLMFPPYENSVPDNVAYLYISKKCFFKNELQFSLAYLTQMLNQFRFKNQLTDKHIVNIFDKFAQETEDRKNGDQSLTAKIEAETAARENADNELREDLQTETDARTEEDVAINQRIDEETKARESTDTQLYNNIVDEGLERAKQDAILDTKIQKDMEDLAAYKVTVDGKFQEVNKKIEDYKTEIDTHLSQLDETTEEHTGLLTQLRSDLTQVQDDLTAAKNLCDQRYNQLRNDTDNLQVLYGDIQKQLSALDASLTNLLSILNDVETGMNNLKEVTATLSTEVETLKEFMNGGPYVKVSGDTMTGTLFIKAFLSALGSDAFIITDPNDNDNILSIGSAYMYETTYFDMSFGVGANYDYYGHIYWHDRIYPYLYNIKSAPIFKNDYFLKSDKIVTANDLSYIVKINVERNKISASPSGQPNYVKLKIFDDSDEFVSVGLRGLSGVVLVNDDVSGENKFTLYYNISDDAVGLTDGYYDIWYYPVTRKSLNTKLEFVEN